MHIDVEQVVREYIDKTVHMSLATVHDGMPWVCEVHFAYDNDLNLYWRSKPSTRHSRELMANPRVAGNIIDKYALGEAPVGVYFEGTARVVTDDSELERAAQCLAARLDGDATSIIEEATPEGHPVYTVDVANWYVFGRFGADSGQKFALPWHHKKTTQVA
jgi:uncharacterized protein YhbP (UPF0306 family)